MTFPVGFRTKVNLPVEASPRQIARSVPHRHVVQRASAASERRHLQHVPLARDGRGVQLRSELPARGFSPPHMRVRRKLHRLGRHAAHLHRTA